MADSVFGHQASKGTIDDIMSSPILRGLPSPSTPQTVPVDGLVRAYSMLLANAYSVRKLETDDQAKEGIENVVSFADRQLSRLTDAIGVEGPPVPSLHAAPPPTPAPQPAAPPAGLGATPVAPSPTPPGATAPMIGAT